jgi:dTMP kinase
MKGQLWVVEGLDGAGKTTMMDKVVEFLTSHGVPYVRTREPGGTPLAEHLRDGLKFGFHGLRDYEISPMVQTMLLNAARVDHVEKVIKPSMAEGKIVLCDRFMDSTFAYQGGAGGLDFQTLWRIHVTACNFFPDMVIMMDGDPKVFAERMADRGEPDKLDQLQIEKGERMRQWFRDSCDRSSKVYKLIDATQNQEQVYAQVLPHLMQKLNELKQRPSVDRDSPVMVKYPTPGETFKGLML